MNTLLRIVLGTYLIVLCVNLSAQRPKHDYNLIFGGKDMGGGLISFSEKEDTVAFLPIPGEEFQCNLSTNTISMSNAEGEFIFYSEGCRIYTAEHKVMKGSENLKIADRAMWNLWCETQDYRIHHKNIMAFPMMQEGHENKYHLIYYKARLTKKRLIKDSLFWAYIDMEANGGEGEIKSINTFIDTGDFSSTSSEVVRKADGDGWWLIQSLLQSDSIRIYKIDANGVKLHGTHKIGSWGNTPFYTERYNRSDASMDGSLYVRLAYPEYFDTTQLEFYYFDNESGQLFNDKIARSPQYGTSSSPFRSIFIPPDSSKYIYFFYAHDGSKFKILNWDDDNSLDTVRWNDLTIPLLPWDKYDFQSSVPTNAIVRGPDCRYYAPSYVPDNKILIFEEKIPRKLERNFIKDEENSLYAMPFNHNYQAPYIPEFLTGTPYEQHCAEYIIDLVPTEYHLQAPDSLREELPYHELKAEFPFDK